MVIWGASPLVAYGQPLDRQPLDRQPLDTIAAVVEAACREEARLRGFDEVTVTVRSLDNRLRLPLCEQPLRAFPVQAERVLGALSVGVRCGGQAPWTIYVRAQVEATRLVPVLARPLGSRSVITAADIELVNVSAGVALNGVLLEPDQIIGMELIRPLEAGSPVKVSQLRAPKLVKRGNLVTILTGVSGLEVRMQGKALGDAAAGDLVQVTNLSSGQLVEGVVNADGTVTVY